VSAGPPAQTHKNPDLVLLDTDSLLQLLIAGEMRLLRFLKKRFRIQPVIVEAVEAEVRKSKKFRSQFPKELQKALDNETIFVLDSRTMPAFVSTSPAAVFNAIQTNGFEYEQRGLDYGEAYTFAAGVALGCPVISNDMSAIRTAQQRNIALPRHLLRTFDLVVLHHQIGELTEKDCDGIRQTLAGKNEFLPAAFSGTSFSKGLPHFYPRLHDSSKAAVGSPVALSQLDVRVTIVEHTQPSS
jgi:hypothetical protein